MSSLANHARYHGHTLVELVAALFASALLLAGLGSVMLIARQIAYTPSAATDRLESGKIVSELADELQLAMFVTQRSATVVEFVVADRDGDNTEELIRYQWSGTPGDPLFRSQNGGDLRAVADAVQNFQLTYNTQDVVAQIETTTDSAEVMLLGNTTLQTTSSRDITYLSWAAQKIDPALFLVPAPSNALSWNGTRVDFQAARSGSTSGSLSVQLSPAGDLYNSPTNHVLASKAIDEANVTSLLDWNSAQFTSPARNLALHRKYAIVWSTSSVTPPGRLRTDTLTPSGVLESSEGGASWQNMSTKQLYYRLYGYYTTPGPTYNLTRRYLSNVAVVLQTSDQTHSRVDASVTLANLPELLSAYWRTDFDADPTVSDVNGDGTSDWLAAEAAEVTSSVPYDPDSVSGGSWLAEGKLQSQPNNNFSNPTTIEVRFRSTSASGSSGAVVNVKADWSGSQHAPLSATVKMQSNGTQSLWVKGQSNDSTEVVLYQLHGLPANFVCCRLTILPANNVVNVCINDEDMGTYSYPTYSTSATDRYLSIFGDTTSAVFDYAEVRVSESN